MGVLPLQFQPGEGPEALGLEGTEIYSVHGISSGFEPGGSVQVKVERPDGTTISFEAVIRIDTPVEADICQHGGILHMVLRRMLADEAS